MVRSYDLLADLFRKGSGVLAAALTVLPAGLHAQAVSPQTREELDPARTIIATPPVKSRLQVEGGVERGPCPLADPAYGAIKVTFGRVTFAGLSAVPAGTLDSTWQDMAGREMPLASLCEVRDRAATALRQMGFLAAVQVPPQRIDTNGEVRMDVLIARLTEVQVRGNPGHAERLIAAHLKKLTDQPWFNIHQAERHLLLLRDLPGFDVRLTLRPANGAPGEVTGDVLVTRTPIEIYASTQNLASEATGREGGFVQVQLNDLTGLGDRTVVSLYNTFQTSEQTVVQAMHDFAIGANGLRLAGRFVYGKSRPDTGGGPFKSQTLGGEVSLSYPFIRREAASLSGQAGLEIVDQKIDFGAVRLSEDRLRVLFARLDLGMTDRASVLGANGFSISEPRWRLAASLEARKGTGLFGASGSCNPVAVCTAPNVPISNLLADPRGFALRFESTVEFRPVREVTFVVSPRAQYSGAQSLSYEQFSLGNYTVGRGFDPGVVQGDSGVGGAMELRYGRIAPHSTSDLAIQPFAFVDSGWAWANDGIGGAQRVWSAGGGLRGRWGTHADFNLTFAVPLDQAGLQTERGDVRVLFTVTARLAPWKPL